MSAPTDQEVPALRKSTQIAKALESVVQTCANVSGIAEQLHDGAGLGVNSGLVRTRCLVRDVGVYRRYGTDPARLTMRITSLPRADGLPEAICRFASHHTSWG